MHRARSFGASANYQPFGAGGIIRIVRPAERLPRLPGFLAREAASTARAVDRLSFHGRDLSAFLRELAEQGRTVVPDVDPDEQRRLRRLISEVERTEGWWLRTEYNAPTQTLSLVRSKRFG